MSRPEVDGLNAGYAALLLEQYLENPSAVPSEWRDLFESAPEEILAIQPGLAILVERLAANGNGHPAPGAAPQPASAPALDELAPAIAAAMSLVTSIRSHGPLAARLDPLGSDPPGDPMLEPERVGLTPAVMARIPSSLLGLYGEGETL